MRMLREYGKKHRISVAASAAAVLLCFGFLVFGGTIRIDTEELINQPGTTVGWLTIGRFGLVLLKRLLLLETYRPVAGGVMFLLFFWLGANLLAYALYRFSGRQERFPYGVFLLLYVTSQIWSFQVYFSLQQAEVALAMLLLVIAAILSVRACVAWERGVTPLLVSAVFLVIGLGSYQALAAYYIAVCMALFLVYAERRPGRYLLPVCGLAAHFIVSYALYRFIANTWFMAGADYMDGQMGWGRLPVTECIKNVLRTAKNILIGYGPRNFSFYTAGVILVLIALPVIWRQARAGSGAEQKHLLWRLLALAGLIAAPFLMTVYMGEMLVTRSQFALPVSAAFLGMYGIGWLRERRAGEPGHDVSLEEPAGSGARRAVSPEEPAGSGARRAGGWLARAAWLCVAATIVVQCAYQFRLAWTDQVRCRQDAERSELLIRELLRVNGGSLPEVPVIVVGYRPAELSGICRRTEMYGWSFYEWDYSAEHPTGATHRIVGFVQAYTKNRLNESATEEQRERAVERAAQMPDFPAEGSVQAAEDFIVVRLSEVVERTDNDWW